MHKYNFTNAPMQPGESSWSIEVDSLVPKLKNNI